MLKTFWTASVLIVVSLNMVQEKVLDNSVRQMSDRPFIESEATHTSCILLYPVPISLSPQKLENTIHSHPFVTSGTLLINKSKNRYTTTEMMPCEFLAFTNCAASHMRAACKPSHAHIHTCMHSRTHACTQVHMHIYSCPVASLPI